MIKTLIVDDEPNALEVLALQIQEYCPDLQIVAKAKGGKEAVQLIQELNPQLVFLDIEMPHLNGFDVINQTRDCIYKIIFTTAYSNFALEAFRVAAVDYLLKPVDPDELVEAVGRVEGLLQQKRDENQIDQILEILKKKSEKQIALPAGDSLKFLNASDIIRCESESNYTHFILVNGKKITLAKTLKEIEENLSDSVFVRIHNSHLVNRHYIEGISRGDAGFVILKDGTRLPLSRARREYFLETIKKI